MPIVSTRIDDITTAKADEIANRIGILLSTAINIFVKRFVAQQGFPFDVVASENKRRTIVNTENLDAAVKRAVADQSNDLSHPITYLDKETNKLMSVLQKEE